MYRAWSRLCRVGLSTPREKHVVVRGQPLQTPVHARRGETISLRTRTLFWIRWCVCTPRFRWSSWASRSEARCAQDSRRRVPTCAEHCSSVRRARDAWARRARWLACLVYKWRTMRFAMRSLRKIGRERRRELRMDPFGAKRIPGLSTMGVVYDLVQPTASPDATVHIMCPVTILHGTRDDLIPCHRVMAMHHCLRGQPKQIRFVPHGTHDMLSDTSTVLECAAACKRLLGDSV